MRATSNGCIPACCRATLSHSGDDRRDERGFRDCFATGPVNRSPDSAILGTALALGLAVGAPAACAVSHLAQSRLIGVSPIDPRRLLTFGSVLAGVAMETALPADRDSGIDPAVALRQQSSDPRCHRFR